MRPFIDISHVIHDPDFIKLNRHFDLLTRLNHYNNATNDTDALAWLNSMYIVLTGNVFKHEIIISDNLSGPAGITLAAIEYARLTINGTPPAIPFNSHSTPEKLVLMP
ncbi:MULTISPECIES: hypothetical protein [unclassified Paludibacterium]|uniref:hypothetical protein n=1 Tax=unclassified Paludibacterium TaxID=2618429 RepID=UPI001C049425|nr:hypothetical protein [Paludibacterium sp. B53371]BEV71742.1 hypothetical protein THUN1379_12240 [Paludibacterium sp. THUN1379]